MATADCVFCKIAAATADALIIHEDDRVISFLPLEPSTNGHTVLVPKAHHADIYSMPDDLLAAVISSCKLHAVRWRDQVGATGINVLHASGATGEQSVFHFHIHLFPRFADDGLSTWPSLPRPRRTRDEMHAAFRFAPATDRRA
jgi:histidine triad (HIT) family protein